MVQAFDLAFESCPSTPTGAEFPLEAERPTGTKPPTEAELPTGTKAPAEAERLFDPITEKERGVVFVVDVSSSMDKEFGYNGTKMRRIDLLRSELMRAAAELNATKEFSIIT